MSDNPTKPKRLTVGSLFAGIGGFDLGFERAGFETVWQVEIDEYCRRVLERHFPRAERFGDIRECGAHNLKPVDVICGGFPCQDISTAGGQAGIDGGRSGLWTEMRRIVCELRPEFIVVENVAELLNNGMGRVLGELAASGFHAEWDVLPACFLGAPHIRERVVIAAYPNSERERCILGGQGKQSGNGGANESLREFASLAKIAWRKQSEPEMACLADGIPDYVDAYGRLGNAIVPQIAQWIAERIRESLTREVTTEHS